MLHADCEANLFGKFYSCMRCTVYKILPNHDDLPLICDVKGAGSWMIAERLFSYNPPYNPVKALKKVTFYSVELQIIDVERVYINAFTFHDLALKVAQNSFQHIPRLDFDGS